MTNPDERRSRIRVSGSTEGIVPLNYGAALAAQIPQVEMPADWDAPRRFGLPIGIPGPGPMGRGVGMVGLGINMAAAIPQVQLPVGWDAPLANPVPVLQNVAATIPQVQLPAGWDAPLMNPVPVVPPAPLLPTRRRRGRGRVLGPLHNISGGQADPALNGLHRGHIALRERTADYNAHVEQLQERENAGRQQELALLLRVADKRRVAEAAASRDRRVQQLAEQERERQKVEEIAKRRESEAVAAREVMVQQLAEQEAERQAATQQAALAAEPLYHDPPRHIDIQAALQERNRREQEWIQQVHIMWRNEWLAEDQVQMDEQEELQQISIEDRNLHRRMMRLEQLGNNMSRDQIEEYRAQLDAQRDQIEMDRAMAAEYEDQHNNEIALRGEAESDQGESDGTQYDAFGRLSPLQFPSSLPPSPLQFPSSLPPSSLQFPSSLPPSPSQSPLPPPLNVLQSPSLSPFIPPPPPAPARPLPPARAPYQEPLQRHSLGPMNVECQHCHALHFDCEKLSKSTRAVPKFGSCCLEGQIKLPPF